MFEELCRQFSFVTCLANFLVTLIARIAEARTGVPNLGDMYPQGYICLPEGVHLRFSMEEQNIFTHDFFRIFVHISVNILLKNHYMLIVRYIYEQS